MRVAMFCKDEDVWQETQSVPLEASAWDGTTRIQSSQQWVSTSVSPEWWPSWRDPFSYSLGGSRRVQNEGSTPSFERSRKNAPTRPHGCSWSTASVRHPTTDGALTVDERSTSNLSSNFDHEREMLGAVFNTS